jgi:hypothetical protein
MALLTGYRCTLAAALSFAMRNVAAALSRTHMLQGPARRHQCRGGQALQPVLSRRCHQHEAGDVLPRSYCSCMAFLELWSLLCAYSRCQCCRRFTTVQSIMRMARPIPPAKLPRFVRRHLLPSMPLASYVLYLSHQDVSTFLAWCAEPEADERKVCACDVAPAPC